MAPLGKNLLAANKTSSGSSSGRWYLAILGLALALIGGIFVWLLGRSFLRAWEMKSWPQVSCVILSSELENRRLGEFTSPEFRLKLNYGYQWHGQAFTGQRLTLRDNPWTSNRGRAEQFLKDYREGMVTSCRVNPKTPEISVLKTDSLAPGYSIWFPGLFVIGGLVISLRALRPR